MARVLYVSQYFVSADQPGGVRHWQHTRALARAGHDVTVVTSYVQHKERTVPERYRGRRIVHEHEDGLHVIRTYSTPGYGRDLRSRLANYGTFAWWSFLAELRLPRPDVVVASSPSLPAAAAAAVTAGARQSRFLLEVRDLWPDSAVAMGLVSNPRVIDASRRLEHFCYRRADRIVALTEGIRDGVIAAGESPAKVTLITNGIDLDVAPDPGLRIEPPVPDEAFVAMYVGAHGTYSSLFTVLDAAERLRDRDDIRFVLVGGGDQKPALVEDAARRGLANVAFVDPVPKREVPAWLARADLCLLPYQDRELFAGALPNKTFDYLAAARPILASAPEGELTRLVREAGCGPVTPPEDAAAMADAVARAAADRTATREMGERGAAYARERYDRRALAARFVGLVESLA
ncbi:MAG: glycosyltransferase family 4 protein [Thermoleophilia bacterium]|jgi:glycosyltransferase involved in cell wall biosynthesis|nr:glycosyltransferase family 4 protein [Thermoleophilia bacterium]